MTTSDIHRTIDAIWRIESAKLIAGLAWIVRDVGLVQDLAQDALVIALEQWPETGLPNKPGAWLMATAKHRAIDRIRRNVALEHKVEVLGREIEIQREIAEGISTPRSTMTSATTSCASSSRPAIRCFRPRRALRSRCACWEV
jgi:predicted RNA polymerase sigma factor